VHATGRPSGSPDAEGDFVSRVLEVVAAIPPGRVMTYGDVAAAIASRSARGVGQVMAYYGSELPWWRVVRATGQAAVDREAKALKQYRLEGTPLSRSAAGSYRVDLPKARHFPR
jgi:alkylated DNA nucleotide flippase Atl1